MPWSKTRAFGSPFFQSTATASGSNAAGNYNKKSSRRNISGGSSSNSSSSSSSSHMDESAEQQLDNMAVGWGNKSRKISSRSGTSGNITNYLSHAVVERMMWIGSAGMINTWRQKTLGIPALSLTSGHTIVVKRRIPHVYCYSEALLAKPPDWGDHIDVCGFWFLGNSDGKDWRPPPHLARFLGLKDGSTPDPDAPPATREPPVFISFGSIVIKDPVALNLAVYEALWQLAEESGGRYRAQARVVIQRGWAELGDNAHVATEANPRKKKFWEESVCVIGRAPHDWVFDRVSCVVHHGGAGTTAAGLRAGRPTIIVPFFGDQYFWGSTVAREGLGAFLKEGTARVSKKPGYLVDAIKTALTPEVQQKARVCGMNIRAEEGPPRAVAFLVEQVGRPARGRMDGCDVDDVGCT